MDDTISERKTGHFFNNPEKIREYKREYNKQKITCECGSIHRRDGKADHKKSPKHQKFIISEQVI